MADIFLSYANEDAEAIEQLVDAIQAAGWSVFWDRDIPPGTTWHEVLDEQLTSARCIVVAWTQASTGSRWVREEAEDGRNRNVLIPVLLDAIEPPRGFRGIQAADLVGWSGDPVHPEFEQLCGAIRRLVGPPAGAATPASVQPPVPAGSEEAAEQREPVPHDTTAGPEDGEGAASGAAEPQAAAHRTAPVIAAPPRSLDRRRVGMIMAVVALASLVLLVGYGAFQGPAGDRPEATRIHVLAAELAGSDPMASKSAMGALQNVGQVSVDPDVFIAELRDPDPDIRMAALVVLGEMASRSARARDAIAGQVDDPNEDVQAFARSLHTDILHEAAMDSIRNIRP